MVDQSDFAVWKKSSAGVAFFAMVEDELDKVEMAIIGQDFTKDNALAKAAYYSGIRYALQVIHGVDAFLLNEYSLGDDE